MPTDETLLPPPMPGTPSLDFEAFMQTPAYRAMMAEAQRQLAALVDTLNAAGQLLALPPPPQVPGVPLPTDLPPLPSPPDTPPPKADTFAGIDPATIMPPGSPDPIRPEFSGLPYAPDGPGIPAIGAPGVGLATAGMQDETFRFAAVTDLHLVMQPDPPGPSAPTPPAAALFAVEPPMAAGWPLPAWERQGDAGEGACF